MPSTPKERLLRSNSVGQQNEISKLVEVTTELKEIVASLRAEIREVNDSVKNLDIRMMSFEDSLSTIIKTQEKHEREIKELKESLTSVSETKLQILEEIEAREIRKHNLVISGIEEKMSGSIQERRAGQLQV